MLLTHWSKHCIANILQSSNFIQFHDLTKIGRKYHKIPVTLFFICKYIHWPTVTCNSRAKDCSGVHVSRQEKFWDSHVAQWKKKILPAGFFCENIAKPFFDKTIAIFYPWKTCRFFTGLWVFTLFLFLFSLFLLLAFVLQLWIAFRLFSEYLFSVLSTIFFVCHYTSSYSSYNCFPSWQTLIQFYCMYIQQ